MRKTYGKCGVLGVVALALLLVLLLAAGTASASTVNTATGYFGQELAPGETVVGADGTNTGTNWVADVQLLKATGPDGWRFIGYGVVCLTVVFPATGGTYHTGEIVFLSEDPANFWNAKRSFWRNLRGHDLLWTGTWDGQTLGYHCHDGNMVLEGWPGSVNDGYTAEATLRNMDSDFANWHSGNFVQTPANVLALVTAP